MLENRDCSNRRSCVNNECVNPCNLQVCGVRAQCDVENHVPVCSCPQRYTGNPFQYCNEIDPSELKPRTTAPVLVDLHSTELGRSIVKQLITSVYDPNIGDKV
uniref:EGF-like domain-containing protein n=1 Tax=Timema shepardi TaxID=629360 RepID=A0A7R9AY25_TIMSH|nr:unnamed protein product [Timema shepardi]